jgi:hypothetical protein
MRNARNLLALGAAMAVLTAGAAPLLVGAADHLESPNAKANHALDITDIYAFDGANSKKTVLVLNVNPLAGVVSGTKFATNGEYRFNIDKNGDSVADDVYTVTFGTANAKNGKQPITIKRNGTKVATGKSGNANNDGGIKFYAGVRDDPFFFDLASFLRWRDPDGDGSYTYDGPTTFDGVDFFAGTNVSSIVLEIPDSWLGSKAAFWTTTTKGGSIIDRMGKPALATVFINPFGGESDKDPYNKTAPSADVSTWGGLFTAVLDVFNETSTAEAVTGLLLPDVLQLDVKNLGKSTGTSFTGDKAGNLLHGRTRAEDVIDLELLVVTGGLEGHAVVATDGVGHNDAAFPGSFPYLAPAQ